MDNDNIVEEIFLEFKKPDYILIEFKRYPHTIYYQENENFQTLIDSALEGNFFDFESVQNISINFQHPEKIEEQINTIKNSLIPRINTKNTNFSITYKNYAAIPEKGFEIFNQLLESRYLKRKLIIFTTSTLLTKEIYEKMPQFITDLHVFVEQIQISIFKYWIQNLKSLRFIQYNGKNYLLFAQQEKRTQIDLIAQQHSPYTCTSLLFYNFFVELISKKKTNQNHILSMIDSQKPLHGFQYFQEKCQDQNKEDKVFLFQQIEESNNFKNLEILQLRLNAYFSLKDIIKLLKSVRVSIENKQMEKLNVFRLMVENSCQKSIQNQNEYVKPDNYELLLFFKEKMKKFEIYCPYSFESDENFLKIINLFLQPKQKKNPVSEFINLKFFNQVLENKAFSQFFKQLVDQKKIFQKYQSLPAKNINIELKNIDVKEYKEIYKYILQLKSVSNIQIVKKNQKKAFQYKFQQILDNLNTKKQKLLAQFCQFYKMKKSQASLYEKKIYQHTLQFALQKLKYTH